MTWLAAHLTIVASGFVAMVTSALILRQRRTPQTTLAWLLFVVLLPYVAVPVYAALGFRKSRARFDSVSFDPGPATDQHSRMMQNYGLPGARAGNDFHLLPKPEAAWATLLEVVASAQHHLDITLYALEDDAVGRAFCDALTERAAAGVAIRMILDSVGALHRPQQAIARLRRAGAEVRRYSPLLHGPWGGHINLRNHRKMVIADGVRMWAGGRNVGAHYLGPQPAPDRWQDLSYRLSGPVVGDFNRLFASDWAAVGGRARGDADGPVLPPPVGESTLQLIAAGPDVADDPLHDLLVQACHAATRRIWIVTPYYLPTPALSEALAMALRRGVDLRLLVPLTSNQRMADLARGSFLRELQDRGTQVLMFAPGMIHAKAVLLDDQALVGSANVDARSLLLNHEVMVLLETSADVAAVELWMTPLMQQAQSPMPAASLARRAVESLFRLVSPIL